MDFSLQEEDPEQIPRWSKLEDDPEQAGGLKRFIFIFAVVAFCCSGTLRVYLEVVGQWLKRAPIIPPAVTVPSFRVQSLLIRGRSGIVRWILRAELATCHLGN